MRIQHNIPAMSSYRNYSANNSAVSKNLEKLSSGYKINRAGDDAAGLAISEKMRAQISGLEQAQSNAKSGINLVQTAEGALTEVHDMLNRMYTLAEQSANGTYDDDVDRLQLQKEVDQLRAEIDRIADSANYNGITLLDGSLSKTSSVKSFKNLAITATHDAATRRTPSNGVYELDLSGAQWTATADGAQVVLKFGDFVVTASLGKKGDTVTGKQIAAAMAEAVQTESVGYSKNGITVSGFDITTSTDKYLTFSTDTNSKEFSVKADNGVLTFKGIDDTELGNSFVASVSVTGTNVGNFHDVTSIGNQAVSMGWSEIEEVVSASSNLQAQATVSLSALTIKDGLAIKIGNETYTFAVGRNSAYKGMENVVDITDKESATASLAARRLTGVANNNKYVLVETKRNDGKLYLTERVGGPAKDEYDLIGKDYTSSNAATAKDAKWKNSEGATLVQYGTSTLGNGKALTLQIGDTADSFNKLNLSVKDMHADAMGIGDIDISTQEGASAAMKKIKDAVNYVSDVRGSLGATQNRLDHTINNLSVTQENIQDAESTIRDVDVAKEMMEYTKNNILVQSAQAMLAQANQLPQGVLQLLG